MRVLFFLSFLLIFNLALTFQPDKQAINISVMYKNDSLIELTDQNYDKIITKHQHILVIFIAKDCENSVKALASFQEADVLMKTKKNPVPFARVEINVHTKLAKRMNVENTPRIFLFSRGKEAINFNSRADKVSIVNWVFATLEPIRVFTNVTEYEQFRASRYMVITYFGTKNDSEYGPVEYAKKDFDDEFFVVCGVPECFNTYNTTQGSIIISKKFDEMKSELKNFDTEKLLDFIFFEGYPIINLLSEKSLNLLANKIAGVVLFRDTKNPFTPSIDKIFVKAATDSKAKREKIKFYIGDIKDGFDKKMADVAGIKEKDLPSIVIFQTGQGNDIHKYVLPSKQLTENMLNNFISDFKKGVLKRSIKSEEPPAIQEHQVLTVVGNTFDEIVRNKNKDVVVMFVYPDDDCGDCSKSFKDSFEPFAKQLKHNEDLVFAKFNIKDNEIIGVPFSKHPPYIKLFLMNDKENPVDYKGDMLKDYLMVEWLMEKSTNPISKYPKYD